MFTISKLSYGGMDEGTQLTDLDHNANTATQQTTATKGANKGECWYKAVFPKHTRVAHEAHYEKR